MRILNIILVLGVLLFTSCNKKNPGIQNITVTELEAKLSEDKNIQLLDVRTKGECSEGKINDALEIDVTQDGFEAKASEKLDKTKQVYVYCRSGGRSAKASEILLKEGYKPVNVEGGYNAWKARVESVK